MRIAWLADRPSYIGGAELTQADFKAAAPEGIEVIDCQPDEVDPTVDAAIVHNCTHYSARDFDHLRGVPVTWYHHDLSPFIDPDVRAWLDKRARHIFCSPMQRDRYGAEGECIPPPIDADRFKPNRQTTRHRKGTCSVAQWRNPGKGARAVIEWAADNGEVDVYGGGQFAPTGAGLDYKGPVDPDKVENVLWKYERMVFLPTEIEPFCRTVAEAHFAGCAVVTNGLVGARYWLEEQPDAMQTAREDFWGCIL